MRSMLKDAELDIIFKKVMDINYFGTVYCTKLAWNRSFARKGTIVGVSSIAGYRGLPGRSGYSASKFKSMAGWKLSVPKLMDDGVNVMGYARGSPAAISAMQH